MAPVGSAFPDPSPWLVVDHALRRRFAFIRLHPRHDILRRFHRNTGYPVEPLLLLLDRINQRIADPNYAIGISFFMSQDLGAHLEDIWRMEIMPYLEEYFFDQGRVISEFSWDSIKDAVRA